MPPHLSGMLGKLFFKNKYSFFNGNGSKLQKDKIAKVTKLHKDTFAQGNKIVCTRVNFTQVTTSAQEYKKSEKKY